MTKITLFFALLLSILGLSQENKVKFTASIEKLSDAEYQITYDAIIADNWKLYSTVLPDMTALPTEFLYNNQEGNYLVLGKVEEIGSEIKFDPIFQAEM